MKRRTFLQNSVGLAAGIAAACIPGQSQAAASRKRQEYYELRAYRMGKGTSADRLHQFLRDAAIPGLNKLGVKPIGVFVEINPPESSTVFVLLPYPNLDVYGRAAHWLKDNDAASRLAPAYLNAPKDKPAFDRIDSWLMLAFAGMPRMEIPAFSRARKPRIFEMRTYEAHNELKAARKVDMFNDGEIEIMRQVNLSPLFYGEALAGPGLPHLTYMTSAEDEQSHKKHWDAFVKHPLWDKMKNDPQYADTVSKITKWFLKPTDYSQI
jgi:hypothetical protein